MGYWERKRVIVTGGGGFLGSHLVENLGRRGCGKVVVPRSREYDLRNKSDIIRLFERHRPDVVIHLAAVVGGIGANRLHPGRFFYENAIMGIQLIEYARAFDIRKFVCLGTICSYPKFTPVPFQEQRLWDGYPEETNAPYGLAKKMLLVQAQAYRQEYGSNIVFFLPANLYGPRDNFDLESSHVTPALIRKCIEARERGDRKIVAWGSGEVSREFLYVEDAAEGILLGAEHYDKPEPVNLGSGEEITVRNLVSLICELTGFDGDVMWDSSRPDGQPRRRVDISRAFQEFGFRASHSLREGLAKTIRWFESNRPATKRV